MMVWAFKMMLWMMVWAPKMMVWDSKMMDWMMVWAIPGLQNDGLGYPWVPKMKVWAIPGLPK